MKILLLGGLCLASPGFALIEGQVFMGWDQGSFSGSLIHADTSAVQGRGLSASIFVDPIPLIPLALGLVGNLVNDELRDGENNKISSTGHSYSAELMLSSPVSFSGLLPYLKAGRLLAGRYAMTHEIKNATTIAGTRAEAGSEAAYSLSPEGYSLSLGLKYKLLPTINLLAEARIKKEVLNVDSVVIAGKALAASVPAEEQKMLTLLVGASLGI